MPAPIDTKLRENIIAEYAAGYSKNAVSKKYNVSWATVSKIIKEAENQVNALREEKQKKYMHDAWEVVNTYLIKLLDPKTVKEAKARDAANIVIGMLERMQRQQELNQQFDFMYENIKHELKNLWLDDVMEDPVLYKEIMRSIDEHKTKNEDRIKDLIKHKLKLITQRETREIDWEYEDGRERNAQIELLEAVLGQIKDEMMEEWDQENV